MRRSILAAAAAAAVLSPPAGAAAQAAPIVGDFGGGAVTAPPGSPFAPGNVVVGLRADGGPDLKVAATIVGACASGTFTAPVPVAADGTFTASGAVRQGATLMRYELHGTLTATPSGTVTARFDRTTGNRTRSCSARDVQWEARRPSGGIGEPAMVPAGALLLGLSDEAGAAAPGGLAVRISSDGHAVSRALYAVALSCSGGFASPTFDLPHDDIAILPDGRVSDREDGTRRTNTSILKYVERFAATLGSDGGEGMFSVEISVRDRATGKRITRCRSGEVRWSASY